MELTDRQFKRISDLVYQRAGIHLTDAKKNLVMGRLGKVLASLRMNDFDTYIDYVENDRSNQALSILINRIATNHTYFWRENSHFSYFTDTVLPEVIQKKKTKGDHDLRIWCAGCSFGDEAYTLMMLIMEFFGAEYGTWRSGLLATDISTDALTKAVQGLYPAERLKDLPPLLRNKYFRKNADGNYQVSPHVREEIIFRRFNLMNEVFPFKKPFDIIFCRNVMIYFDKPTRDGLVRRFAKWLVPGGYLFIGHSESLGRDSDEMEYVRPAVYRRTMK